MHREVGIQIGVIYIIRGTLVKRGICKWHTRPSPTLNILECIRQTASWAIKVIAHTVPSPAIGHQLLGLVEVVHSTSYGLHIQRPSLRSVFFALEETLAK